MSTNNSNLNQVSQFPMPEPTIDDYRKALATLRNELAAQQDGYEAEIQGICRELALTVRALLDMESGIDWSKASDEARRRVFDLQAYLVSDGYLEIAAEHAEAA